MTEAQIVIAALSLAPQVWANVKTLVDQWQADGKTHASEADADAALQALSQDIDTFDASNPPSGT